MASQAYPDTIQNGPNILPIDRIKLYSPDQWEKFIEEWVDCLKIAKGYSKVERFGGAGDMGRDVVASLSESVNWDNYQCKHYGSPLTPGDVWCEFGKLSYYTHKGEYSYPRAYCFVAPQGVGTKLANLLKNPVKLKAELKENWDKYCTNSISSKSNISLTPELESFIDSLDFSIFGYVTPLELIIQFRSSMTYSIRFGGGLPPRPESPIPPDEILPSESIYIQKLLDAYSDFKKQDIKSLAELDVVLKKHCIESRRDFFSAEALRLFSRDSLPEGSFEQLQEQFLIGISDDLSDNHADGLAKLKAVVKSARTMQITNHPLTPRMDIKDRGGICHQLANENDDVRWVNHE